MIITQMMPMATSVGTGVVTITISANVLNFNMFNNRSTSQHGAAVTVSGTYVAGSTVTVVVNSGVYVGSSSNVTYGFDTGTGWNGSDVLILTNNGSILGIGGAGNGGTGGPALRAQRAISITNNNIVGGGGGAGGAGAQWYGRTFDGKNYSAYQYGGGGGGGGGQGYSGGAGGAVNGGSSGAGAPVQPTVGGNGSATAQGTSGNAGVGYNIYVGGYEIFGGPGGAGGTLGGGGAAGGNGYVNTGYVNGGNGVNVAATAGGVGGACTNGNANITWTVAGTRYGTLG